MTVKYNCNYYSHNFVLVLLSIHAFFKNSCYLIKYIFCEYNIFIHYIRLVKINELKKN